jgi:hypothetical protein
VIFAAIQYFDIYLITAHDLRTIMYDTMACMQSNEQSWCAWDKLFEFQRACGRKEMWEEVGYCLLQALGMACGRVGFFAATAGATD